MAGFLLAIALCSFSIFSAQVSQAAEPFKLSVGQADNLRKTSNVGIIGINYSHGPGGSVINQVYPGTPASRTRIQAGDKILAVDSHGAGYFTNIANLSSNQVYNLIAGFPGTSIVLKIYSPQSGSVYNQQLTRMERDDIPSDNVFRNYLYGF